MFKIMTKKAFDAAVAEKTARLEFDAEMRKQNNNGLRQLLNAANANCADYRTAFASLENMIADMQPDYRRGVARRLACEKELIKRKAARAAK